MSNEIWKTKEYDEFGVYVVENIGELTDALLLEADKRGLERDIAGQMIAQIFHDVVRYYNLNKMVPPK